MGDRCFRLAKGCETSIGGVTGEWGSPLDALSGFLMSNKQLSKTPKYSKKNSFIARK